MNTSVKHRIAIAMSLLVFVNVASAGLTWLYNSRAAESAAVAREQSRLAHQATVAAQQVSQFVADGDALAFTVSRSRVSEDSSVSYGRMQGSEHAADLALHSVRTQTDSATAQAIVEEWEQLRTAMFLWVNAEAELAGSSLRIMQDASGRYRAGVTSNLTAPADLGAMGPDELRRTVRDRGEVMKNATLRKLVRTAEARAAEASLAERHARETAAATSLALIVLSVLLALIAGVLLYRTIALPLQRARDFANRVAEGDLAAVHGDHADDEIGDLTDAVECMKNSVVARIDNLREMAGAVLVTAGSVSTAALAMDASALAPDSSAETRRENLDVIVQQSGILESLASQMLSD